MKNNASLSFVNIICNSRLDNESAIALGKALRFNTSLRYFIWKEGKDRKSAKLLLNELKNNKSLKLVTFVDSCIDDDGIEALANGLKYNKTLGQLEIPRNYHDVFDMPDIGPKGINALVDMWKVNETVYIQLGPKDYETLEKALKDNKISSRYKIHTTDTYS